MKRFLLNLSLAFFTFQIGLIAVYFNSEITSNLFIISQEGQSSVSVNEKSRMDEWIDSPEMNQRLAEMKKDDFYEAGHACGGGGGEGTGASTAYLTFDKKRLFDGSSCFSKTDYAKQAVENLVLDAKQIIEVRNRAKNENGEVGKSWILLIENDYEFAKRTGINSHIEIIWYGGKKCYGYISAPDLKSAKDLQRYMKKQYEMKP